MRWALVSAGAGVGTGLLLVIGGPIGLALGAVVGWLLVAGYRDVPRGRTVGLMATTGGATAALLLAKVLLVATNDPTYLPSPTTAPLLVAAAVITVAGLVGIASSVSQPPASPN